MCKQLLQSGTYCSKPIWKDEYCKLHYKYENPCAICFDPIVHKDRKILSCNHYFHEQCLDRWFEKRYSCPTCRRDDPETKKRSLRPLNGFVWAERYTGNIDDNRILSVRDIRNQYIWGEH